METKDLNHAAFLISRGQKLENSRPDSDGRFWFIFTDNEEIDQLSKDYYMNDGTIQVQTFINAQKTLKNLIRNYKSI